MCISGGIRGIGLAIYECVQNLLGGERAGKPELYAYAAHVVITRSSRDCTGNLFLC
jgi:hypothetical protein